jgi:hypothetical protein
LVFAPLSLASAWIKICITDDKVGDVASIAGVVISVIGFVVTVFGVFRSKAASEAAAAAATSARDSIRAFETIVDFTAAISRLEDLRLMHRSG